MDKPLERTVKNAAVIQSLRANQTLPEFRDMLTELPKDDEQLLG